MSKLPVELHTSLILALHFQPRYPKPERMMSTMIPTLTSRAMSMADDVEHCSSVVSGGSTTVQELTEEVV